MKEQSKSIECVSTTLAHSDIPPIQYLNFADSIDIFVLFTLITAFNKLWKSINKTRQQRKFDLKLLLQSVGAIGAILKAINDVLNRDDEDKDD
jgi:hypothetical protein